MMPRRRRPTVILAAVAVMLLGSPPASGQSADATEKGRLANYPYTVGDTSFLNVVGQSVQVYRIPVSYTIPPAEARRWDVRLNFPFSFGFHEISGDDLSGDAFEESFATISVVPGVEFAIPIGERWILSPFADLGVGKDLEGGEWAYIYAAGLEAIRVFELSRQQLRFGTGLRYDGSTLADRSSSSGFSTVEVGLDLRFPIERQVSGRGADISVYAIRRRYLSALEIPQPDGESIELRNQNEIGLTFGVNRPFELWLIKIDRVGIGYRFGSDLTSIRILFGVPF